MSARVLEMSVTITDDWQLSSPEQLAAQGRYRTET